MKSLIRAVYISGLLLVLPSFALAAPGIPNQFYGTAKYTNGSDIAGGNVIVKIGATQVASEPISNGKYGYNPDLLFVTDANSDRTGSILKFFIDTVDTGTTAVFANGGYTKLDLTIATPSDTVSGNGSNVFLSSATAGQADMPTGATNIVLTNTTVMDISSGLVGGKVTLQSGISGQPIVLTNSSLANVSASFPDGTEITGPSGWDGKITPPVAGTPSGTAPAGFSVGSMVISIGSPDGTLVFDNAVTILLAGVTGTVGYRPSGSNTWIQITNACGGNYTTPNSPTFPGECAISNGTDTKIVTYHFTTFGSLTANSTPAPSGGGGGGGTTPTDTTAPSISAVNAVAGDTTVIITWRTNEASISWLIYGKTTAYSEEVKTTTYLTSHSVTLNNLSPATAYHYQIKSRDASGNAGSYIDKTFLTLALGEKITGDINKNNKVDIFDFNLLMVNWGNNPTNFAADLDGNGKVDIFDFNLLMVNWTI